MPEEERVGHDDGTCACADGPLAGRVIGRGATGGIITEFTHGSGDDYGSYKREYRNAEWAYYWTLRA